MNNFKKICSIAVLTCACVSAQAQWSTDSISDIDTYGKYRIGGYGEIVGAFKDYYNVGNKRYTTGGTEKRNNNTISIPRFVIAGDYKFTKKWILGVEIEFESGGVGTAYELENNSENGEYETEVERGGEVALEQFHITYAANRAFNVRAGHIIVPVGQNNAHHEPLNFFGTVRPEGETSIIPNTWHETGLEFFGRFGKRWLTFNYQAMVVSGLNANGFDKFDWAGGAKQGIFEEENFTSPGYAVRLDYIGVPGLRLGASFYYCRNIGSNADKNSTYAGRGSLPVRIYNIEAEYKCKYLEARVNGLWGNLTNSDILSSTNGKQSNKSPYTRQTPIAHKAVAYGGELGLNIRGIVNDNRCPNIIPFARYEYYNPQQDVIGLYVADERAKTSMLVAGLNWRLLNNLVAKADYTTRRIGDGKFVSENEFAIGLAWAGWFFTGSKQGVFNKKKNKQNEYELLSSKIDALNARLAEQEAKTKELENKKCCDTKQVTTSQASIFFDINSSEIKNNSDLVDVDKLIETAKQLNSRVLVSGYADSKTGSAEYNSELSKNRANNVAKLIEANGINKDKIDIKSFGGVDDLIPDEYNRRVIISIVK